MSEKVGSSELATFGAGCYWGTEKYFRKNFEALFPKSIIDVKVGFMGGKVDKPSYNQVCNGSTGHVEVAQVTFNPAKGSYEELVKFFYTFHDPTTLNKQGNDSGVQYGSVIFTHSTEQERVAKAVTSQLSDLLKSGDVKFAGRKFDGKDVTTRIIPASTFFPAHEAHQMYLIKDPGGYCNHTIRMAWPSSK